ncbi:hypothetical protein NE237_004055 [Protea cynaroides]|uniref:Uncharacterized protein n=1 Tax=Protea cynaroides TaxID=273540 RepID=A0A9Q0KIN4_9MAGN|nr:hypothetical protein NE237_004055 [Protea cynaroides]
MAGGMKNVVEMGPLPPRYPNSAVNAIMNGRHSGMLRDAKQSLKMIMQPNKAADYPVFNDPFALLENPTSGRITRIGTTEFISSSGGAQEPNQGINDSIIKDGVVRPSSDDVTASLVDDEFKKNENFSSSFDENPNIEDQVAATSSPSIKLELENLYLHKWIPKVDPNNYPKNLRVIGSRLASLKSRVRKLEYIAQLEQQVDGL